MDQFSFKVHNKSILVYRSIFAPVKSNMYVILTGKEAVVFDPNKDEELLWLFKEKKVNQVHILLTHEHYDHTSGVNWLQANTGADVYGHVKCAEVVGKQRGNNPALIALVLTQQDKEDGGQRYQEFKAKFQPYTISVDNTFDKEDSFVIGDLHFKVTATPGHSPGSACYELNEGLVFTGDTLLQNDPVVLRFAESRKNVYEEVALPYLRSLKKSFVVMPGHGDPFLLSDTKNI